MKVLITGVCGFLGASLAELLVQRLSGLELWGIDNFSRRGSELNYPRLKKIGLRVTHGDVRLAEDLAELPPVDWILDCAALPSVLAGLQGGASQLVSNNLIGTLNLLEKCRRDKAGLIIVSSSRVYSIRALAALPLVETKTRLEVDPDGPLPIGFTPAGVAEAFSTAAPVSLYGATKLASEQMAVEYGMTFGFPVRVNRCGVIAGPGQFGRIDQGIFSYWIYQWLQRKPLGYIGFGGRGLQVRDLVTPLDLAGLIEAQLRRPDHDADPILNAGGGHARSLSLRELSAFCRDAIGTEMEVRSEPQTRTFDIPYFVTDATAAKRSWGWVPQQSATETLEQIVRWARDHLGQLELFS